MPVYKETYMDESEEVDLKAVSEQCDETEFKWGIFHDNKKIHP